MRVAIFTEGGPDKGYGHLTRCSALGAAFLEMGRDVVVYINGPVDLASLFPNMVVVTMPWTDDSIGCGQVLDQSDVAVFDSYDATADFYGGLMAARELRTVFFDDSKRIAYPGGFLINGSSEPTWYDNWGTGRYRILAGTAYQPMRRVFWDCPTRICAPKARKILITLGADDIHSLMPQMLERLPKLISGVDMTFVTTRHSRTGSDLQLLVAPPHRLVLDATEEMLLNVFYDSDIAISAGGQTVYELARTGLPTVLISVIANQGQNIAFWLENGFASEALMWDDPELISKIANEIRRLSGPVVRQQHANLGQGLIDGQGARRSVARILAGS